MTDLEELLWKERGFTSTRRGNGLTVLRCYLSLMTYLLLNLHTTLPRFLASLQSNKYFGWKFQRVQFSKP